MSMSSVEWMGYFTTAKAMWKQWLEDVMDGWKNALFKIL